MLLRGVQLLPVFGVELQVKDTWESGEILNHLSIIVIPCYLPQDVFENHPFSLLSSQSSSGIFGIKG